MYAYFCSVTIGTGKTDDPYRPEIGDAKGVQGWAACYEQPKETRAVVLVKADDKTIAALAQSYERIDAKTSPLSAKTSVLAEVTRTAKDTDAAYTKRVLLSLAKRDVQLEDLAVS